MRAMTARYHVYPELPIYDVPKDIIRNVLSKSPTDAWFKTLEEERHWRWLRWGELLVRDSKDSETIEHQLRPMTTHYGPWGIPGSHPLRMNLPNWGEQRIYELMRMRLNRRLMLIRH